MVVSILALDIFRSVRFTHSDVISRLSGTSFNAFYYILKTDAYNHSAWNDITVSKAVRTVPGTLADQPIFLSLSFPVYQDGKILYLSVPVSYRLWNKEKSILVLAAELAAQAMKAIGPKRQGSLLWNSWYPTAEVATLVEQFENLEMICNLP